MKSLYVALWAVCATTVALAAGMLGYVALRYPETHSKAFGFWVFYSLPYFFVLFTARDLPHYPGILLWVFWGTAIVGSWTSYACYLEMELDLEILAGRAEGKPIMSCGPPPLLLALFVEYVAIGLVEGIAIIVLFFCRIKEDREEEEHRNPPSPAP